jgi:hypothetical protein
LSFYLLPSEDKIHLQILDQVASRACGKLGTLEIIVKSPIGMKSSPPNIFNLGGGAGYSTRPTVTYSPLQGEEFVQRFLSPVRLDTIMLPYRSGRSLKRVFRMCVQRLNDVENAARASGPTPERAPEFRDFSRALALMRELQNSQLLDLECETFPSGDEAPRLVLVIKEHAWKFPQTDELADILKLEKYGP